MASKFRKKPVIIEAIQLRPDTLEEIKEWITVDTFIGMDNGILYLEIPTLEGVMRASVNDWVIKGVRGEFYPCKPDIFEMTYEKEE